MLLALYACVILNSEHNEGYDGCPWSVECGANEVITPHALAVEPEFQGISEEVQENGSVIMEIVREYGNNKPTGHYLD